MALPKTANPKRAKAAAFMRKAIQYYEAGDLAKAHKNVSKYLSVDPANPDANHLAGLIAHKTGKPETAVKLITRAIEANPKIAMAHNNLGEAYRELENYADAEKCYRQAIALEPAETGFYNNLGIVLFAQEKTEDALAVYESALKRNPRDPNVHTNLGNALLQLNKADEAITAHKRALSIQPSLVDAQNNLGLAYMQVGDVDRARECFEAVLARQPQHVGALGSLAQVFEVLGDTDKAIKLRDQAIRVDPDDRELYLAYADLLRFAARPDEAVEIFERHLKHDPSSTDSRVQIASIWRAAGEREKAQTYLRDILLTEPDHVATRTVLAQMTKHTEDDENISGLKSLRAREDLPVGQKASINFAYGKAMEDIGDHDTAIEAYIAANRFRRSEYTYAHVDTVSQFDRIQEAFSAGTIAQLADAGSTKRTPIFIVGMPRSGTSLVEQIISSHSQVYGAGELTTLSQVVGRVFANRSVVFPDDLPRADREIHALIGDMYVEVTRKRFGDTPRLTDKLPHNFLNVGAIRLALPNAKIVHCQRHPMDTCLSIFKNAFSDSHDYAYNMEELGLYYREYLRLMAHWREVFPGAMHEISYEKLVADTEPEARALLEYCELDWEPECLEFYKTKRVVNTVSASQVRQPIYKSSVALWKQYGAGLQPLIDALGDAIPAEV